MEVIRHDAVAEDLDREFEGALGQELKKALKIGLSEEQLPTVVSTIRHMNRKSDGEDAMGSWRG